MRDRYEPDLRRVLRDAAALSRAHARGQIDSVAVLVALGRQRDSRLRAALTAVGCPPEELAAGASLLPGPGEDLAVLRLARNST